MIRFLPLGGADEIGASCFYLNIDGTGILLDCGIHPQKTKTEIIVDLISTSLEQLEESMPSEKGALIDNEPSFSETGEPHNFTYNVFEDVGIKGRFNELTEKHLRSQEKDSGGRMFSGSWN